MRRLVSFVWSLLVSCFVVTVASAHIKIHIVNVGQAAAAIVEFDKAVILIDAGGDEFAPAGAQNLKDALQEVFTARELRNTLEAVIVSHPHTDHTRNLGVVFQANGPFKVNMLVDNGEMKSGSGLADLKKARSLPGIKHLAVKQADIPKAGKTLDLPGLGNATITLLSGFQGCQDGGDNANNDSIALIIRDPDDGGGSVFFGGDSENESKANACTAMLNQLNQLDASIVNASVYHAMHHGSPNGSLDAFQKKVHPTISVISSGVLDWRNCKDKKEMFSAYCYGHPRDGSGKDSALSTLEGNTSGSRPAKTVYFMAKSGDEDANAPVSAKQETKAVYDPAWDGRIDIVFQSGVPVVTTQLETAPIPKDRVGSPIHARTAPESNAGATGIAVATPKSGRGEGNEKGTVLADSTSEAKQPAVDADARAVGTTALAAAPAGQPGCTISAADVFTPKIETKDYVNQAKTDYYMLSLSWSPAFCHTAAGQSPGNAFQCSENSFGMVVHGLWAQTDGVASGKKQPRNCKDTTPIPTDVITPHLCTMPGSQFIQNEWAKHGTCAFETPANFLKAVENAAMKVLVPDLMALSSGKNGKLTAKDVTAAFLAANSGLKAEDIQLQAQGKHLEEVHVCLDKQLNFRKCDTAPSISPGALATTAANIIAH